MALHVAASHVAQFDRDGVVRLVDYEQAPPELGRVLDAESADVFTTEMLAEAASSLEDLSRLDAPFAAFVEPPSFDEPIVN